MSKEAERERAQEVADTIFSQMGGGRAMAMIGMWAPAYDVNEKCEPVLTFRFKGTRSANHCKITLTSMDLYDMEISRYRAGNLKRVAKYEGLYADMLKETFENTTKLYLSL